MTLHAADDLHASADRDGQAADRQSPRLPAAAAGRRLSFGTSRRRDSKYFFPADVSNATLLFQDQMDEMRLALLVKEELIQKVCL